MAEPVTDAMVEAARTVLSAEMTMPYMARARDWIRDDSTGEDRELEMAALRAADEEASVRNDDLIRRAIAAALAAR